MKLFPSILAIGFIASSCTYREAKEFIPIQVQDSVSFTSDILPILQTSCFGPGYQDSSKGPTCHYPPGTYGGIPVFYDNCSNLHNEAISGRLYDFVLGPNASMPLFPVPPLPPQDTALFGAWIREGAPCN